METFSKEILDAFDAEVIETLRPLLERHGLTATVNGGAFSSAQYNARVEFKVADADRIHWNGNAAKVGLSAKDFGARFEWEGSDYELVGLTFNANKRPVRAREIATGEVFTFKAHAVVQALARARDGEQFEGEVKVRKR